MSPATSKMLLKTIRDSDSTSQELHICAIFCSAKSIQLLHQVETVQDFLYELDMKRQMHIVEVIFFHYSSVPNRGEGTFINFDENFPDFPIA